MGNPAFGFAADWIVRVGGLELGDQTSRQRSRLERSPAWLHELASFVLFPHQLSRGMRIESSTRSRSANDFRLPLARFAE